MRILFVTSTRIGDAVLSTGLLDHLIRTHPGARITIACGPVAEGVFARMPGRERTIVVTKRRLSLHWLDLWSQVATTVWDLVVDLRGSALGWLVPARRRAVMRGGRRPGAARRKLGALDDPSHLGTRAAVEDDHRRGDIAESRYRIYTEIRAELEA